MKDRAIPPIERLLEFTEKLEKLGVLQEAEQITLRIAGVFPSELLIEDQAVHLARARGALMVFLQERFEWNDVVLAAFFDRERSTVRVAIKAARKHALHVRVVEGPKGS